MAKTVKKSAKPVAKKATPKKAATKPIAKKATVKPTTKKVVAKPTAKKVVMKPAPKKVVVKKDAKKSASKKVEAKKSDPKVVAKKIVAKPAIKKATPKKSAIKPATKKVVAKPAEKKAITKKVAAKPTAKKLVEKKPVNIKPTSAKLNLTIKEDKSAKLAERRKKIQEIKNNYETPSYNEEENYDDFRLPIVGRTRFSDTELNEFKTIINKKLAEAREELDFYQDQMKESEMNDDDIKFSGMEDGGHTNDKEHLSAMANRQIKFIQGLESALIRIENKTYGICRMTGNLIDKKRLMAVPHATLSMEAKVGNKKR